MTEAQTIDWVIKIAQERSKKYDLSSLDKAIFEQRIKTLEAIKAKVKRIDYFGGIETLIAKASTATQSERLFADNQ